MTAKKTKACPECGKSLHAEAVKCSCGWQDARAAARVSRDRSHACQAFGCPLPGTLFSSAQATEGWCYLHDAHREGLDLQALTREIQARASLFAGAYALYREVDQVAFWTTIPGRYARPFRGREEFLPTAEERTKTSNAWLMRVRRDLEAEILAALGKDVRGGKRATGGAASDPDVRRYEPSDDDIAAAAEAEREIEARAVAEVA